MLGLMQYAAWSKAPIFAVTAESTSCVASAAQRTWLTLARTASTASAPCSRCVGTTCGGTESMLACNNAHPCNLRHKLLLKVTPMQSGTCDVTSRRCATSCSCPASTPNRYSCKALASSDDDCAVVRLFRDGASCTELLPKGPNGLQRHLIE